MCSDGGQQSGSRFRFRNGFSWVRRVLLCTPATCHHLLMLHFMLHKLLIRTKRTRLRPADGKTRGRAPGYLEIQIEEIFSCVLVVRTESRRRGSSLSVPFLNVSARGCRATLRVRSIKPTQKTSQLKARWTSDLQQQQLKPAFVSHDWQRLGLITLFSAVQSPKTPKVTL